ncbi:MAG: 4Fe-4S dicluster domain-containing protein [Sulfuricurvum sp.]|uniref:4Fe-4S dicluster domain-containing protein n=1 Tax=Sulfuricurvum sp. TaxID=2025608 RepID=UPI002736321B|nr:4Fe-4S dicluster domain-containing protein [Sulfuricurvum sp.]MDP2850811.1 4Fe-4S dicluster domain-containing protein [Sulfuricurvum sp.]MDP3290882.1 4Fe-4S dicluster domain-containing protein [Sulfuricurvum sp.]
MAVIINDTCITCDACLQQCPVNAIVDDTSNPTGKKQYYVQPDKCVECVGLYDDPQCAAICPSIGCITWDMPFTAEFDEHFRNEEIYKLGHNKEGKLRSPTYKAKSFREDIPLSERGIGKLVQEEPEEMQEVG